MLNKITPYFYTANNIQKASFKSTHREFKDVDENAKLDAQDFWNVLQDEIPENLDKFPNIIQGFASVLDKSKAKSRHEIADALTITAYDTEKALNNGFFEDKIEPMNITNQ